MTVSNIKLDIAFHILPASVCFANVYIFLFLFKKCDFYKQDHNIHWHLCVLRMYPKEFRYDDDNNEQMDFCDKGFQRVVEIVESFGVSGLQKKKKKPQ